MPLEERFDELFTAARVLLREDAAEHRVIPTLAFANEIGQGRPHLIAEKQRLLQLADDDRIWDERTNGFSRRYGGLRPDHFDQGILVLEKELIFVGIGYADTHETPVEVVVSAYQHRSPAMPAQVARRYEEVLFDAGVPFDESNTGGLSFSFYGRTLEVIVRPGTAIERMTEPQPGWRADKAAFPHPRLVDGFYQMLLSKGGGGFRSAMAMRTAGEPPKSRNLVPACVAFILRTYGLEGRKVIHRLLNEHVLCEIGEELTLGITDEPTCKLWRTIKNASLVGHPISDAARTLFYEGYEYR